MEAGVTKPVVYARVGGRAEVANALSERLADRIMSAVFAAIQGKPIGRATLVSFLVANLEVVAANHVCGLTPAGPRPLVTAGVGAIARTPARRE